MNPLAVALRGKGLAKLTQRAFRIIRSYGLTSARMDRALRLFATILAEYDCSATFPITASVLERHPRLIADYAAQGIEFAIHGYYHIDHWLIPQPEQISQIDLAKSAFEQADVAVRGFRGPYLHANDDSLCALKEHQLAYDSSQGLAWDVLGNLETVAYRQVLEFYGAKQVLDLPSLPELDGGLVRIPYSLPDDESLANRLDPLSVDEMNCVWVSILEKSHALGELFTIGLHPERIAFCESPLRAVLEHVRDLTPQVWCARLDEIADWWRTRRQTQVVFQDVPGGGIKVQIVGDERVAVLARNVELDVETAPWAAGYDRVQARSFTVRSSKRPVIGVTPGASAALADFLLEQGYIVERSEQESVYPCYFALTEFVPEQRREVLVQIEETNGPLLRLGRWPDGAQSALSITGDIDALTLWDYGLRFAGR